MATARPDYKMNSVHHLAISTSWQLHYNGILWHILFHHQTSYLLDIPIKVICLKVMFLWMHKL